MDKENIIKNLKNKNIWFELEEHQAVFNMDDLDEVNLRYKNRDAKNIFVRDDKKLNYYLITIKGDKKVDLKQFRKNFNTRNLSFASAEDLMSILKLIPGSVSPLGILNDEKIKVRFFIDKFFFQRHRLFCHATIKKQPYLDFISMGRTLYVEFVY